MHHPVEKQLFYCTLQSPVGNALLVASNDAVVEFNFQEGLSPREIKDGWQQVDDLQKVAKITVHCLLSSFSSRSTILRS